MTSMKKFACVLTVVAAIGGIGLAGYASAQSLPSGASCIASCGIGLGDCAGAAGQANSACAQGCATVRGSAAGTCAQACAQGTIAAINSCKATFSGCATACSAS
jgi:hypothetical protein